MEHALSTSSCTGALHLALKALEIGPGDEVLVPECTWVATASAVTYVGATPVMVDVQADTWCMDPEAAERAITSRTRAMIPVHLYGQPADMLRLVEENKNDLKAAASRLIARANENGGPDNITCCLVRWLGPAN